MVGAILLLAALQLSTAPRASLLETGDFHGNEVTAQNGERWLGLVRFPAGLGQSPALGWRSCTVSVTRVKDEIVDEEGRATGKRVAADCPDSLLLVRGLDHLAGVRVQTLTADESVLEPASRTQLRLGESSYQLAVDERQTAITLSSRGRSQTLYAISGAPNDASWSLVWAGDLDGDGRLDLYLRASHHYNINARRLFLSSLASGGQLVKEAAVFETTGC